MGVIAPNTEIIILQNVPLDNTYEHTIYFSSKSEQETYFKKLKHSTYLEQSYQRVGRGKIRLQVCADKIYTCNYLMFKNTSFGDKWFYAFIRSVDYVNNIVSEIEYEIDVMQTWFFDFTLQNCFVEREHSSTDEIGDNLVAESLETGEYVFNSYSSIYNLKSMLVIMAIVDTTGEDSTGNFYDGIYGGATMYAFKSTDLDGISEQISHYIESPDTVVGLYMCPSALVQTEVKTGGTKLSNTTVAQTIDVVGTQLTTGLSLDGYKPKNNKLYTYPYNFYHIDNASGSELTLRYEYFTDLTPRFKIEGSITQPVQVVLRPYQYKGSKTNTLNTESIVLGNYPLCSWNYDAYNAWLAQNSVGIATSYGSKIVLGAIGLATGGLTGVAVGASLLGSTLETISKGYKASLQADVCKGNLSSGNVNVSVQKQLFYGGRCSVNSGIAKTIDNYFTMYGYATNLVKEPNRTKRPHWNYVKTVGCIATGSVPSDDMNKICKIHDNGITYWKNGNEVGDYTLDNSLS